MVAGSPRLLVAHMLLVAFALSGCLAEDDPDTAGTVETGTDDGSSANGSDGADANAGGDSGDGTEDDPATASGDSNEAPMAILSYTTPNGGLVAGVPIAFDAAESSDDAPAGTLEYRWDFGDGRAEAFGLRLNHTFADPGSYAVTLTVTDPHGASDQANATLTIDDDTVETSVIYNKTFTGSLVAPNALMGGEDNLTTATLLGVGEDVDHVVLDVPDVPEGSKLDVTLIWAGDETLSPLVGVMPDLDLYVYTSDGAGGFGDGGATGSQPEQVTASSSQAALGHYQVLVILFAGGPTDFELRVEVTG